MATSKALLGAGFVLLSGFLGLFGGTLLGPLFVPPGSGLAGPAIALGHGVAGLAMALAFAVMLSRKLNVAQLRAALLWTAIIALVASAWIVYRVVVIRQQDEGASMFPPRPVLSRTANLPGLTMESFSDSQ